MTIVRWEPARDFGSLQQEVNRVFSSFFDPNAPSAAAPRWTPAMDLHEREDAYLLTADLPGVAEDDLAIDVEGDVLTVSGARTLRRDATESGIVRRERAYGSFRRQLTLPEGVDAEAIRASFDRGVLEITIPKPERSRPRRVSIQVGDAPMAIDAHGEPAGDADAAADRDRTEVAAPA